MQKGEGEILYRYEERLLGGAVRITITVPRILEAAHEFLRYQIFELHTGDPMVVAR